MLILQIYLQLISDFWWEGRRIGESHPRWIFQSLEGDSSPGFVWRADMNSMDQPIAILVGGWTNPFQKYARQIGSSPQGSGVKI